MKEIINQKLPLDSGFLDNNNEFPLYSIYYENRRYESYGMIILV